MRHAGQCRGEAAAKARKRWLPLPGWFRRKNNELFSCRAPTIESN